MPPEASEPFIFVLAEVVAWFIGGAAIGIGIGAVVNFVVRFVAKRANARLAARRAAELDERLARHGVFTPHPPLFDELAEPDAFEDREDPSSTIGRAS